MTDRLFVSYGGPALDSGRMEARELAPALLAVADMFEAANRVVNGERAKVSVSVNGFKSNCFRIDFDLVQDWLDKAMAFFAADGITSITNLKDLIGIGVKGAGLLQLRRFLRGREVTSFEDVGNGMRRLTTGEDSIIVHEHVEALYRDKQMAKAVDAAITQPLSQDGIDLFVAGGEGDPLITIDKAERLYFAAPPSEEEVINDITIRMPLNIVTVAFQDGNMWRFARGDNKFSAPILDEDFLKRVARNEETFGKDDLLIAMVRQRETIEDMATKTRYEVVKVLEHRRAPKQPKLFIQEDQQT